MGVQFFGIEEVPKEPEYYGVKKWTIEDAHAAAAGFLFQNITLTDDEAEELMSACDDGLGDACDQDWEYIRYEMERLFPSKFKQGSEVTNGDGENEILHDV